MPKVVNTLEHCVYVLLSEHDGRFYIGRSSSLEQRLCQHMSGRVPSTRPRRPLRLVHTEHYAANGDAVRREAYLKTTQGKRTLRLMLKDSLVETE